MEIPGIVWVADEGFHLAAKKFNVFQSGVERDEHIKLLFHRLTPCDILNPQVVEYDVRYLHHLHIVDAFEDSEEEGDLLDDQELLDGPDDVYAVADIIRVFDEEEDARTEEFLGCGCEDEGE